MDNSRVPLPRSEAKLPAGAVLLGPVDPAESITVSVALKPATRLNPEHSAHWGQRRLSRREAASLHGAHPRHLRDILAFAAAFGLNAIRAHQPSRRVFLRGTTAQMEVAFGVSLVSGETAGGTTFRTYEGSITLPFNIAGAIIAVHNLETNPELWHRNKAHKGSKAGLASEFTTPAGCFTVPAVMGVYNFPAGDGTGQTIGLIEPDGNWAPADMATFFANISLTVPNIVTVPASYDGLAPVYGATPVSDWEVAIDIQMAGAVCPKATLVVYHGVNIAQALASAIFDDVNDPGVLSLSWSYDEDVNGGSYVADMELMLEAAASLGITVCCDSGDWGSAGISETDGQAHVQYPSASPWALAVGATTLVASGDSIGSEAVWSGGANHTTTGGVSRVQRLPSYQVGKGVPVQVNSSFVGRGIPDVAINGDPNTGIMVVCGSYNTLPIQSGGTSMATPLWAGLIARMNQSLGKRLGFVNSLIYSLSSGFHDITSGTIGAYSAGVGWDACTGLGSPNGAVLLAAIAAAPAPVSMPPIYGKRLEF